MTTSTRFCTRLLPVVLATALSMLATSTTAEPALRPADVGPLLQQGHRALDEWRLQDARAIAVRLSEGLPDVPAVQELVGRVKFHEGDFEGAVQLLRRASEGGAISAHLDLAESTYKETQHSVTFESEHFVLRVPKGKDEVLQGPALMALEKSYDAVTDAFDYRPQGKIAVDVLHDARGLAQLSSLTVKEIETSGTIALCKYNRLMITSPKALARGYGWLDTLAHEFIHLVISEKSHNEVPIWLHEGLAKYSESLWRGQPGLALQPASEALLADALKKKKLITFEQMHPSMAKLPSQNDTALAFAEVFTVIEFLHAKPRKAGGKTRKGYDVTNALIDGLRDGKSMDRALKRASGFTLASMQKAWKRYLKKRKFKLVPGAQPKKLKFVRDARRRATEVDDDDDEAAQDEAKGKKGARFVRLGNLMRRRGHKEAALVEYEKALARQTLPSPMLLNRVAQMYLDQGRTKPAHKLLRKAVRVVPDDPQTHVLLGRRALLDNEHQAAERHYRRATWENPFHPEVYMAFVQIGEATKDDALVDEGRKALRLLQQQASGAEPALKTFGTISITSAPWGQVIVDGRALHRTTPLTDHKLSPGRHVVRVESSTSNEAAVLEIDVKEGAAQRHQLTLKRRSDDDERAYAALLRAQHQDAQERAAKARKEEHLDRGLTGIPFADFEQAVRRIEDLIDGGKSYQAHLDVKRLLQQLDDEVEDNAYQRQWLLVLEVDTLHAQRRHKEAVARVMAKDDKTLSRLPLGHVRRLYDKGLASFREEATPEQVVELAQQCADAAKQGPAPEMAATCLLRALQHLESVHQVELNELPATQLLQLARDDDPQTTPWLVEAVRALLQNHAKTQQAGVKATLLTVKPRVLALASDDPVVQLVQASLQNLQ